CAPVVLAVEVAALPAKPDLLHGDLQFFVEDHRIREVPAVEADQAVTGADVGLATGDHEGSAGLGCRERTEAPRRVQVVLGARAADRRCLLTVEEHLHLALTPPVLAI